MVSKMALEEHFLCSDFIEYWNPTVVDLPAQRRDKALSRLTDFGEMRLTAMNEAGIARAVLALAGPGVQAERDTATAVRRARAANDFLVREIDKRHGSVSPRWPRPTRARKTVEQAAEDQPQPRAAVALRQPRGPGLLRHQARQAAVTLFRGEFSRDHVGYVLGRAAQLHHRWHWDMSA